MGTEPPSREFIERTKTDPKTIKAMKSVLVRRKHVDLDHALTAMSDPDIPTRDAMIMSRKALRRANGSTKELLSRAAELRHSKTPRSISH